MAEYKVNIQKLKSFLPTTMKYQREIRDKIPYTIMTRKIKYLVINLTNEVKDLYSENYTPLKEIKTQTNRSLYRVHGLERLTSLKCPYFLKQSIDLMRSVSKYR